MGVLMQAFYWDCPVVEGKEHRWWDEVRAKLPEIKRVGFTALWLPPAAKGFGTRSMGYDVYDYYDLGDQDQKGGIPTLFGRRAELDSLIAAAHAEPRVDVYADVVFNHNSGADQQEKNPIDKVMRWTKFDPKSGKFVRTHKDFHPCVYESWDHYEQMGEMPDLCHRNPRVYKELLDYARWLIEKVGFDGFRYDMVKGYGGWVIGAIQEYRYNRPGRESIKPFGVGEYWDEDGRWLRAWLDDASQASDNPVSAMDFPLRSRLKGLCDSFGYDLNELAQPGALYMSNPTQAVTFVENHDLVEPHENPNPISNDKMLAYAFILTHEGYPCVFWKDYFNHGLAREGSTSGIAALVGINLHDAVGKTEVLSVDHDLYIMQRLGEGGRGGLVFVLNNRGDGWNGQRVQTAWANRRLVAAAFGSSLDSNAPVDPSTDEGGWGDFWAPPRGYAVFTLA
jgi:alpha-amylase